MNEWRGKYSNSMEIMIDEEVILELKPHYIVSGKELQSEY